ncbi:phosphotransferase [Roseburia sp. 1XD42-34]|nr:phosphotransferase [Roseburia sp. 1XD42-34]NBJ69851.1 serine kinase [Roseburia sp. 1XD42-34]RKI77654.1 serine kinase [Clostridium sp. 1xD42-85]
MHAIKILEQFHISVSKEPVSIYPYSPVYHVLYEGKEVIVKKTQKPLGRARTLAAYTQFLQENDVSVVTPIKMDVDNPQAIGQDCYVVYPFIKGEKYRASNEQIYTAGALLGNIHALSPAKGQYLLSSYNVYDFTHEEVEESVGAIATHAQTNHVSLKIAVLKEKLLSCVSMQTELQQLSLPHVLTPHDYKANNLVYTPEPYLIDLDNAARVPRIFDLALALLLFHNEMNTAPDIVFTVEQWNAFLAGYYNYVQLTDLEKESWDIALKHVFLDEVMWLMAEVLEDWEKKSQRKLFSSVVDLFLESKSYQL